VVGLRVFCCTVSQPLFGLAGLGAGGEGDSGDGSGRGPTDVWSGRQPRRGGGCRGTVVGYMGEVGLAGCGFLGARGGLVGGVRRGDRSRGAQTASWPIYCTRCSVKAADFLPCA